VHSLKYFGNLIVRPVNIGSWGISEVLRLNRSVLAPYRCLGRPKSLGYKQRCRTHHIGIKLSGKRRSKRSCSDKDNTAGRQEDKDSGADAEAPLPLPLLQNP
jgi:hypothetical protein